VAVIEAGYGAVKKGVGSNRVAMKEVGSNRVVKKGWVAIPE
jgi:hypothetical protein